MIITIQIVVIVYPHLSLCKAAKKAEVRRVQQELEAAKKAEVRRVQQELEAAKKAEVRLNYPGVSAPTYITLSDCRRG